ncbi:MAG: general secretion pathway protein GspK [bacterium]|nr:general secretion pathway protein GspK [bacterium]
MERSEPRMILRPATTRRRNGGFALLVALGLLAIFVALGTAWLRYMALEQMQSRGETGKVVARTAARGGIEAAMAQIGASLKSGDVAPLLGQALEVRLPAYRTIKGQGAGYTADRRAESVVTVTISDECARVNLNHAPTRVLRGLFGEDGRTARLIRQALPREDGSGEGRIWFTSVDELVTRNLVDAETLAAIGEDLLTVYSVGDRENPSQYINVNTASEAVLAAVLGVDAETAAKVVAARPFASVGDLVAAAGKPAATFNVRPNPDTPEALPAALCFESRCFRITSSVEVSVIDSPRILGRASAEAVVCFDEDGQPEIRFWSEVRKHES